MTDAPLETAVAPPVTPTETPLPNSAEARNPDGTLKDAQTLTTPEPKPEPKAEEKPVVEPAKVPERYDFKAPEGQKLDDALVERATPLFKELGLTQEQAQKLVDFYNTDTKAATTKLVSDMHDGWRKELMTDPDIGPKLGTVENPGPLMIEIGKAKATIFENDPAGLKAFNDAMDLTGGNHPAIFKGFLKMAQRINEGGHVRGTSPSSLGQNAPGKDTRPTAARSMYPNLPSTAH